LLWHDGSERPGGAAGQLAGAWACTVDYNKRILFEFVQNPDSGEEEILLLTMGTHDEVY